MAKGGNQFLLVCCCSVVESSAVVLIAAGRRTTAEKLDRDSSVIGLRVRVVGQLVPSGEPRLVGSIDVRGNAFEVLSGVEHAGVDESRRSGKS